MGKKVAQSEAGRSASKAAVKGATDAATKDLTDRYLGGSDVNVPKVSSKPTAPSSKPAPTTTSSSTAANDSDEEFEHMMREATYQSTRRNKEKPSVFARFKPSINLKAGDKPKPQPRQVQKSKKKVYKYAAAVQANWESLPQAMTLYNFRAEMRSDLEFRKGQVIQVMTRTDSQNDWWEGRIDDRVGIFPANFVKML